MNHDPRIERYLVALEARLKPFSVGDRAEIVTEIRSHILSALERDPSANVDHVLAALGEPEAVANRYLLERGLKPGKPPISPVVKWLVIGFLGTVAMLFLFIGFLVSKFAPMVSHEFKSGALNEVLEIDDDEDGGKFSLKGVFSAGRFNGELPVDGQQRAISVKVTNVKLAIENADAESFTWECDGVGSGSPESQVREGVAELNLVRMIGAKCELKVPKNAKLAIEGTNAKIELDEPHFNVNARVTNAKVEIAPDEAVPYKYDLLIGGRKKRDFPAASSEQADAYLIHIELNNGRIVRAH